ncbi:zinc-binding dehydrogenase [Terrabacter sp. GCM10028922]|uniref:zinc-binding dehydrogenase n=1 Tax=Terrabacter sp. GCM10028922 TaxID=3273428 RepID=UPI003621ACCC
MAKQTEQTSHAKQSGDRAMRVIVQQPGHRPHRGRPGHPCLERTYPLEQVPDALRHLESGTARGKLAITVSATNELTIDTTKEQLT